MRGYLRLVLVNLLVFAVLLTIGLMVFPIWGRDDSRNRAALPNYANSPWAAKHFQELADLNTKFFSYVEWRRELFTGETINIVGKYHERRTPLPSGAGGPTVFFFGGSAMWGTGSRDSETIPSFYAARTGRIVRNFGESAYTAHQDLEMLMWLLQDGERPNVVVFYDGVNDVWHKCGAQVTSFSNAEEPKMRWRLSTSFGAFLEPARTWLDHIAFGAPPNDAMNCDTDPAKAKAVAESMVRDWDAARLIAESQGISFRAALQPVAFFSKTDTDRLKLKSMKSIELKRQFAAVYPLIKQLMANRPYFADFTEVMDVEAPVYVDFCHVSPEGNERAAAAMVDLVDRRL